jgi:hypothetical protein
MLRSIAAVGALLVGIGCASAQGPIAMKAEFHISEKGNFLLKTGKEAGTKEAALMATAACAAFGVNCAKQALRATQLIKAVVVGDNRSGKEHRGIIRAPAGYEICKAKVDWSHSSIDGETTFNSRIVREPKNNGLGFYAVVPKFRKEGHWVDAPLYLEFVPAGKTAAYGCWPTNVYPWVCKGPNCNNFYPGARYVANRRDVYRRYTF